ncbi:protein kinase, partial [Enterobacter cloacae]
MNENELPAFWPAQGNLHDGRVFVLKEDVIFTVLAQEGGISWMNARHPHSGGSFIIATAVSDEEEERATRLLKNEFALRDHLQDSWAIRAVASTQYRGRFALVYAPFSFELLARRAGRAISGIARFIELAIQISTPLRQMHLQNLIHGDIKPGNIFVHHDSTCRLGSFGLSCSISGAFSQ